MASAVHLNWTASYDINRNGVSYSPGITATTYHNSANVAAGQTYTYFVRAKNSLGTTDSNTITISVPGNIFSSVAPDLTLSANPTLSVSQGDTARLTLTVQSVKGFSAPVSPYALNLRARRPRPRRRRNARSVTSGHVETAAPPR